ncbi:MAG: preprotein translocase subunit SecY [Oscillospiraceae bacterium]|nr:preprotein translocase subunit SecY [Oscillospiraceae bacterium]
MGSMFQTLRNALKIPDLRKKLLFTVMLLLVYRIGAHVPVPGLNQAEFASLLSTAGTIGGFFDLVTGGAFKNATIFAMGITPYINSSIIMQLLTVAIPALEKLQKEGEEGRKKIQQWVRYGTVILAFVQSVALYIGMRSAITVPDPSSFFSQALTFLTVSMSFTAGTAFLMWIGEKITDKGIGNGISLIIFAGIVSSAPDAIASLYLMVYDPVEGVKLMGIIWGVLILIVFVIVIAASIWIQQGERRIPIQYAKRVVGRKMVGGQSTHLPIKVNMAGVIPIIFAMSITALPSTVIAFFFAQSTGPFVTWIRNFQGSLGNAILNALLIVFFTFFYTVVQFNPVEVANNLKKNGGFIPGIRPGRPTADFISKVLNKLTWFGGIFLAGITIFPNILGQITGVRGLWFGGTSVLILVGVALETVQQIESQMLMRHYKGFLE